MLWIVDDDRSIRFVLEHAFADAGFTVRGFASAESALEELRRHDPPACIFTDVRMPGSAGNGMDGLSFLRTLRSEAAFAQLPVVVMSAFSDLSSTVAAFDVGAFDFLAKPFDIDQAVELGRRALRQNSALPTEQLSVPSLEHLIGQTPAMQEIFRAIGKLSRGQLSVLITGETGTGKELIARALHQHSPRASGPFVAINTAAIAPELLESELFGHEQGAFTGALRRHSGRFEQAAGGTLFLDEIGDMPASMQAKLLRVLAEGEYFPVGARAMKHCDVRILAATHQDLEARVASGDFRADLLHRLNVVQLRLPPLRERRGDIPALAEKFLLEAASENGEAPKRLSADAQAALQKREFTGNVRELKNLCQRLAALAPGDLIFASDMNSLNIGSAEPGSTVWQELLEKAVREALATGKADIFAEFSEQFEQTLLQTSLDYCDGQRQIAAQRLGVGRNVFARKLKSS